VAASAVQAYADRTLTVKQAMGRTGLSKSELHRRKEMGEFGEYRKVGRHHLLFEIQVEAWLDRQVVDPLE
jgi:predicted DNA-binding transcriptional regulator AlpA